MANEVMAQQAEAAKANIEHRTFLSQKNYVQAAEAMQRAHASYPVTSKEDLITKAEMAMELIRTLEMAGKAHPLMASNSSQYTAALKTLIQAHQEFPIGSGHSLSAAFQIAVADKLSTALNKMDSNDPRIQQARNSVNYEIVQSSQATKFPEVKAKALINLCEQNKNNPAELNKAVQEVALFMTQAKKEKDLGPIKSILADPKIKGAMVNMIKSNGAEAVKQQATGTMLASWVDKNVLKPPKKESFMDLVKEKFGIKSEKENEAHERPSMRRP